MTAIAALPESALISLAGLVDRAAGSLTAARTAAEVLDARDQASFAYDVAKKTARLMKAKQAHDDLIAAAYRAQADALEIEAQAKRRLADEYDAAQERGEVQRHGGQGKTDVPTENIPCVADVGLSRKDIHEARIIRDAEAAQPGIVRQTLDNALSSGEEPTKAKIKRAMAEVIQLPVSPKSIPARGKEAVCTRVAEAILTLSGLPPAKEVAGYFRGAEEAVIVSERIENALNWLLDLSEAWENSNAEAIRKAVRREADAQHKG